MTSATSRDDLAYAVVEGVGFSFADGLAALREAGAMPQRRLAIGGCARADTWLRLMANALGLAIDKPLGADVGPALGAARLASLSLGLPLDEIIKRPPVHPGIPRHPPDSQPGLAGPK